MCSDDNKMRVDKLREMLARERPNSPCLIHDKQVKKVKGLGDVIAALTSAVGIKPCKGCKRRQAWLNKIRIR
jgi:hypothetical protein